MNKPRNRYESRRGGKGAVPPKPEPRWTLANIVMSGTGNMENQGPYHERPTNRLGPGIGSRGNKNCLQNLIRKIVETSGWLKALK